MTQKSSSRVVRVESRRSQRTIARDAEVVGFGLWTGRDVRYRFHPAADDAGIAFYRADLPNAPRIPARVENRVAKPRQTSLAVGSAQVDMVEHVLAALRAARVDNCEIEVDAPEAPGMDGSALAFIDALLDAGTVEQTKERALLKIVAKGTIVENPERPDARLEFSPTEEDCALYEYNLVYDAPNAIPNQCARFNLARPAEDFAREIAPCRTFLTLDEALALRKAGVCQRVTASNALVFGKDGPIDAKLRFENECARHKLLDMTGDFALAPFDWSGEFRAFKTGHQQNAFALRRLLDEIR